MLGSAVGTEVVPGFGVSGDALKCHSLPPAGAVTRAGGVKCFVCVPAALAALHRNLLLMQSWGSIKAPGASDPDNCQGGRKGCETPGQV